MNEYNPETQKAVPKNSIVLDPKKDFFYSPERVAEYLRAEEYHMVGVTLRNIGRAIEAQTKPSRIPEPGKYGIVKAVDPGNGHTDAEE
jgi:hypothetical protein